MSASGSTRSVAGILAGSLRFGNRRHLDAFLRATADYELHVATYASGAALALTLTCSLLLIPVLPASMPTTMMQWVNLQAAVRYFRHRISPHIRSIVRLRTDVRLLPALLPHPPPNMLYAFTDRVFYAERSTFLRLFSDIGDASQFRYTSSLPPRSTPLGGRDQEILQRMLLANGTDAHSGGCVHPCERLSQRECPHTRWHRLPWRWAPPTDALCGVWPNHGVFCSETAFSYHVYAGNVTCMPLPKMDLFAARKQFRWGLSNVTTPLTSSMPPPLPCVQ